MGLNNTCRINNVNPSGLERSNRGKEQNQSTFGTATSTTNITHHPSHFSWFSVFPTFSCVRDFQTKCVVRPSSKLSLMRGIRDENFRDEKNNRIQKIFREMRRRTMKKGSQKNHNQKGKDLRNLQQKQQSIQIIRKEEYHYQVL